MILRLLKAMLQFVKKKAKEASQRVEEKIRLRELAIKKKMEENIGAKLGILMKKSLYKPAESGPLIIGQVETALSGLNSLIKNVNIEPGDEDKEEARVSNIFSDALELEEDKAKREKQELKDQKMKDRAALKKLKRADYSDNILSELSCENLANFY